MTDMTATHALPGWGIDADAENDPTWPMRDQTRDDSPGMNWTRPPQQPETVEILRSIEHNRLPAVFGTSTPPRGLSGMLRRFAFKFSESQWAHWLALMGADRINMVEGVFQDIGRGRFPNIWREMGLGTELKHNRKEFVTKVTIAAVVTVAVVGVVVALRD
jgi:hypothetical protein